MIFHDLSLIGEFLYYRGHNFMNEKQLLIDKMKRKMIKGYELPRGVEKGNRTRKQARS